jgi:hypothetical protein
MAPPSIPGSAGSRGGLVPRHPSSLTQQTRWSSELLVMRIERSMPSAPLLGPPRLRGVASGVATAPGVSGRDWTTATPDAPGLCHQACAIRVVAPEAELLTKLVIWERATSSSAQPLPPSRSA